MAEFREFYVPPGAGSNFLASKCLWTDKNREWQDTKNNEFFFHKVKSDATIMEWNKLYPDKSYKCTDQSLISESIRIKPILIELDKFISDISEGKDDDNEERRMVISQCDRMWREDYSVWTSSFKRGLPQQNLLRRDKIILYYADKITQIEDYFAKCREYYYSECERNNWNMFQITHLHPYFSTSPRLKLPENMITMAMELDAEMSIYNNGLIDIKMNEITTEKDFNLLINKNINKSVTISNKKVSFRKIYFENNEDEIRKMYDFFDNEDYFDENRVQIMSEFRQYHDDNMSIVQKFIPKLYKQLKTR